MNRHSNRKQSTAWAALVTAVALCVALAPAALAQEIAQVRPGSSGIDFLPVVEHGGFVLTVSGPDGFHHRAEFGSGESPIFSIFDEAGGVLADGVYNWELSVIPSDTQRREAFEANRVETRSGGVEPRIQSGAFSVVGGAVVAGGETEPGQRPEGSGPVLAPKTTILTTADGTIINSLCVGTDCTSSETFGFDTIRLKENNTRIRFFDTSVGSFPTVDWEIQANDSASGGQSWLRINDLDNARSPFTIEANTPSHTLYVDSAKRVGIGTSTPVVQLHVKDGNSPTLRLEQDTSSGFAAQTWDVAGNEANFFVRSATTGSQLPFRIRPGAPTSSIDIAASGNVGIGTAAPQVRLDVQTNASLDVVGRIQNKASDGFSGIEFLDHNNATKFFFGAINSDGSARLNSLGGGHMEFRTSNTERLRIAGNGNIGIGGVASPIHPIEHTSGAHLTAGGAWIDGSSRENKQDITRLTAEEATAALAGLDPVKFRYKTELDEEYVGFLAEEVPELVAVSSRTGLHSMDLVAVLTKVAQEQQEAIETQQEMIDTLLRKVEQLESER